jgi:hypothetical protein
MAHRDDSLRRINSAAIGAIADMPQMSRTRRCDANDPNPTQRELKSRSAGSRLRLLPLAERVIFLIA